MQSITHYIFSYFKSPFENSHGIDPISLRHMEFIQALHVWENEVPGEDRHIAAARIREAYEKNRAEVDLSGLYIIPTSFPNPLLNKFGLILRHEDPSITHALSNSKHRFSPGAELNLQKLDVPPIRELPANEVVCVANRMLKNILKEWQNVDLSKESHNDIDQNDWHTPKRFQQVRWNKRLNDTCYVLELIKKRAQAQELSDSITLAYYVSGTPVGLLLMSIMQRPDLTVMIEELVTHPGSEGVASVLVEQAIYLSDKIQKGGKVVVLPLEGKNSDAQKVYEALGFCFPDNKSYLMELNPETSDKWCEYQGSWRLKKSIGKNYIGSL